KGWDQDPQLWFLKHQRGKYSLPYDCLCVKFQTCMSTIVDRWEFPVRWHWPRRSDWQTRSLGSIILNRANGDRPCRFQSKTIVVYVIQAPQSLALQPSNLNPSTPLSGDCQIQF